MTSRKVTTTERSLALLQEIKQRDGATLTELTATAPLARSTVHKHLWTLLDAGYLAKEGERYVLGLKFLNYGEYARSRKLGYNLARETIRKLADETNEEVDFIVENDGRGIVVHESYHPQSQYQSHGNTESRHEYTGTYYYLHSIAAGKAILAELPDERVAEIVEQWGLPARTDHTITDVDVLMAQLEEVRDRGVALTDEEFEDGMRAVGRRVTYPDGSLLGSISITVPKYRMTDDVFYEQVPDLLRETVGSLEAEIREEMCPT
ncbi:MULTISPECIES: IclR family transcriptional regulator [unclassified Haladaptatus]|uniref:IclR family transcriptional regulator n=1 Tax=unclassified Haladaptatus TaxID=2622732 RepID=UPI0023E8AA12|nr:MULTISPECIES: IclR family transcriptional regulator [unclassified Haladaptatus]